MSTFPSAWELAVAGVTVIAVLFLVYAKFTGPEPKRRRWSSR